MMKCTSSNGLNIAGKYYRVHAQSTPGETLYPWVLVDTEAGSREWVPLSDFASE